MAITDTYKLLSDEELVAKYHSGDEKAADYLIEKYKNLVRKNVRSYYLAGADNEDLLQEGMLGLFKAIRDYNPDRDALFMTFASLCVSRHIRSTITRYNRKKNGPLNGYVSFEETINDNGSDEDIKLVDTLVDDSMKNPEEMIIAKEQVIRIQTCMDNDLSKFEKNVVELYIEGLSYAEIGERLQKPVKSIDNAIQRIRNKILKNC